MYNYRPQAFFHVKDEEAFLHFPKAQEVQSFILLVACTTADISLKDCCRLGYSFLSIANPIQPGFILQVKKSCHISFLNPPLTLHVSEYNPILRCSFCFGRHFFVWNSRHLGVHCNQLGMSGPKNISFC